LHALVFSPGGVLHREKLREPFRSNGSSFYGRGAKIRLCRKFQKGFPEIFVKQRFKNVEIQQIAEAFMSALGSDTFMVLAENGTLYCILQTSDAEN